MSQHLDELVEKLSQLTVLDMAKLKEMLEAKWGVKAAVAMAAPVAGAAAGGGEAAAPASESTEFKVILEGPIPDDKKIAVIKEVRMVTGLGLKEAKELVEGAPKELKTAPKAEAEEIQKKLQAAGAKVTLKGV